MVNCYIQVYIVIPAMDSYEDNILISLQLSNDLVLPVRDSGHQVVLEHQLLPHFLHDVLEQPEVDWVGALTKSRFVMLLPFYAFNIFS